MRTCDVLIVGGGPAGSSCARQLVRAGIDTTILDKNVFPRDKTCGGWITPGVLSRLKINAEDYASRNILQPITAFRTSTIGGAARETRYGRVVSYGIRRREFDHHLLQRSGAKVIEGAPLETLERRGDRWIANGELEARVLVGAGGHFCPVARILGAKSSAEPAIVAQEIEFEMSETQVRHCAIRGDTPELFFCRDLKGYGWCFRKRNVLNIGLGRADHHRLSEHVAEFFALVRPRLGGELPAPHGHAYLLHGSSPRRISGDGWLLIGDAAGLAYPFSGEGILPAIESGLLAAEAIASGNLASYVPRLDERFRASPSWIERAGAKTPAAILAWLAPHLLRARWFARGIVLDRWFLHPAI